MEALGASQKGKHLMPIMNARLTGDRCPFVVGTDYVIPITESTTDKIRCYQVDTKTGTGFCVGTDGQKYRAYAYGWSDEELAKMGPAAARLRLEYGTLFFRDFGYDYIDASNFQGRRS